MHVWFAYVVPFAAVPENVFRVRFSPIALWVRARLVVCMVCVLEPVWWAYASHEYGLHSAQVFGV